MTVFGLQWTQATDAMVRPAGTALTHKAVTSPTNAETLAAVAQASTYAPWSGMRRCNLWDDGTPTAYYGDRCYTDTDVANMGQCMVQVPKFWYTTDHGGGVYIWYISDTGAAGTEPAGHDHDWAVHPAFIRDGVTKSYIYLSAYEAYLNGTKLESKSGAQPAVSQTITQFRTAARERAGAAESVKNKWELQDYLTLSAVQLLYLIEYGSFRAQTVLSAGISNAHFDNDHNQASNTGHTSTLGNASGQVLHTFDHVPNSGDLTGYAMSYRGIENAYGNIMKVVDGINLKADYAPWIADHDFASDTFAHPYVNSTATPLCNASGWATDIKVDATYDYGFLASVIGGAAATHLSDYYDALTGNRIMVNGGGWGDGGGVGFFRTSNVLSVVTSTQFNSGARLMYIG